MILSGGVPYLSTVSQKAINPTRTQNPLFNNRGYKRKQQRRQLKEQEKQQI